MTDLQELELGALFIALWLGSLIALWLLVDRKSRAGKLKNHYVVEGLMLMSIFSLLAGGSFLIKGFGIMD
ncbi:MAG: hypothetical protein ACK4TL_05325 [Hyphomicrobiaceae bacterium]